MKSLNYIAHLALFGAALIYAGNYSIAKIALDDDIISPNAFIMMRLGGGAILVWMISFFFRYESIDRRDWPRLFICVLTGACLNMFTFFNGLKYTTPINASLLMILTPLIVLSIALFLGQERLTWNKITGMVVSGIGATILLLGGNRLTEIGLMSGALKGDLLVLTNAFLYGIYLVFAKKLMEKYNPFHIIKWLFTLGFLMSIWFVYNDFSNIAWSDFNLKIWLTIAYVVIGTTVLTYGLNAFAISKVRASVVSIYVYLQPFMTTIIAVLIGKDEVTLLKVVAAILILTGIVLASLTNLITKKN